MEELYYYSNRNKIPLIPSLTKRAIIIQKHITTKDVEGVISIMANGPSSSANAIELNDNIILLETPSFSRPRKLIESQLPNGVNEITVFEASDGTTKIATHDFIVQFRPEVLKEQIEHINQEYGVNIKQEIPFLYNTFILRGFNKTEEEVIRLANLYQESGLVNYSHPDFVRVFKRFSPPNDPLFINQWGLNNTGQNNGIPGQDINIYEAWKISQGSPNITIAILDTGVDYNHPDLNVKIGGIKKLVAGYNAQTNSANQQPELNNYHGTACAGIAAALTHNGEGIAGVAPNCRLMGIRIAQSNGLGILSAKESQIANGINYAVEKGADILSCSWGGGDDSASITNSIINAKRRGRNGKGCAVIFAAGNEDKEVNYPGNLDFVLTVTACNEWGQRKSYDSNDNEQWWSSNFGPEVDVCAPGVNICTTSNVGKGNVLNNNYIKNFRGTSAAVPIVAGVAALILSVNPNFKADEVERIIKFTANNLEGPGYDVYTGFGRVNAGAAVRLAAESLHNPISTLVPSNWFS